MPTTACLITSGHLPASDSSCGESGSCAFGGVVNAAVVRDLTGSTRSLGCSLCLQRALLVPGRISVFDVDGLREEPDAGKPHVRICEGEAEWLSYSTTIALDSRPKKLFAEQPLAIDTLKEFSPGNEIPSHNVPARHRHPSLRDAETEQRVDLG
jgi:hypothetical protein